METRIKCDDYTLIMTNDEIDNHNYIQLFIDKEGEDESPLIDVPVDELLSALIAYDSQRGRENYQDKEYDKE